MEILIGVSCIFALIALAIPVFSRARLLANTAKCSNNLKQIGVAMFLYENDHQGVLPQVWTSKTGIVWNDRLNLYLGLNAYEPGKKNSPRYKDSAVWWCPGTPFYDQAKNYRHYALNSNIMNQKWNYRRSNVPELGRYVMVGECNKNGDRMVGSGESPDFTGRNVTSYRISHNGGKGANYLFCDGHVEYRKGVWNSNDPEDSIWKWWSD